MKAIASLQRKSSDSSLDGNLRCASLPPMVSEALRSASQPLTPEARAFAESRFGHDFSKVRIHADATADKAARSINASAFTVGDHVVFRAGQYNPEAKSGLQLLAHELTHVVQQGGMPATAINRLVDHPGPDKQIDENEEGDTPAIVSENLDLSALALNIAREQPGEAQQDEQVEDQSPASISAKLNGYMPLQFSEAIVSPDHGSEHEAEMMSNWAVSKSPIHHRPIIRPYTTRQILTRRTWTPVPEAQGKPRRRLNLVFIMGVDKKKSRNKFYKSARVYFETHVPNDALINDDDHRNLASVFEYLRTFNPREVAIGNLYLVSHANEDGTLSFPLTSSEEDKKLGKTGFPQLRQALQTQPGLFTLPKGLIDRYSTIHIKGCNIGRSTAMLNQLDQAFGGKGEVTAPTHKQQYQYKTDRKGKVIESYEAMAVYYLEFPGLVKLKITEQLAQFREKYTFLSERRWKSLLGKSGATRKVLTPLSLDYTAPAGSEQAALDEARAWGNPQLTRPEMYQWRITKKIKQKDKRILYKLEANKTNYTVDRVLTDEAGKRLTPERNEELFYGASEYEPPVTAPTVSVKPESMTVAELFEGIARLTRQIKKLPSDDEEMRRNFQADWEALKGELSKHPGRMKPAEIIKVIGALADNISKLAVDDPDIRNNLLTAADMFGEKLRQWPPGMSGPAIITLLAQLKAELVRSASGDASVLKNFTGATAVCEDALRQRIILIDVKVAKTEDILGADEVYVKVAGRSHVEKSAEVKLNDGQSFTFGLPTQPYLPMNAPLSIQVYDADWPDADDLIVRFEWKPPFKSAINAESFDQADYRVRVHFDR